MQLTWKGCLKIGVTAFLFFLAVHYWEPLTGTIKQVLGAATPILIGLVVAYIINILMVFYEKRFFEKSKNPLMIKAKIPVCMLLAMLSFVLIISLI